VHRATVLTNIPTVFKNFGLLPLTGMPITISSFPENFDKRTENAAI